MACRLGVVRVSGCGGAVAGRGAGGLTWAGSRGAMPASAIAPWQGPGDALADPRLRAAAVAMLAKIGVKVNLEAIPKAQHFPKIQKRSTDFYLLGWGVPTLDSHSVFSYLLSEGGSWNATGYSNPKVNEITAAIATETDIAKRTAMIDEAWQIIKADMPYVPIHHQVIAWGVSEKLNVPIGADDALRPRFAVMQ